MMGARILSGDPITMLPDSNKLFTGRYSELQKIDTELLRSFSDHRTRIFPPAIQIYGPAGIGKTQLAREYVNQKYQKRNFSSILWIEARSIQSIEKSFSELARRISNNARNRYATMLAAPTEPEHVESTNIPRPSSPLEPISAIVEGQGLHLPAVKLVKEWLRAPENNSWLMVFDGADDCRSLHIDDFIPDVSHGNIILTSRNCDFAKFSRSMLLGPMSEKDAIELLFKTTSSSSLLRSSERKALPNLLLYLLLTKL
jgi:Cdc6-like AAA superfamily ATPase